MASTKRPFLSGFLTGLAVGLGLSLAVALWVGFSNPFVDPPTSPTASTEGQTTPKVAPDYDFYKSLPSDRTPSVPQETPAAAPDAPHYLQAGAFLNAGDAEEMKARLALLGYEASIAQVADSEAITLHRVRIGPFKGMDELNIARTRLTQNGIDTLLIKITPTNPTKENP